MEKINLNSEKAYKKFKENLTLRKNNSSKRKLTLKNKNPDNNFFYQNKNENIINELKNKIISLSNEEIEIIETVFKNQNLKIEDFLQKICSIEKFKQQFENENKKILKEQDNEFNSKNLQIQKLNNENSSKDQEIIFLENQFNDYKQSKKILENKMNAIQNSIKKLYAKIYEKEKEGIKMNNKIQQLQNILIQKKYDPSNKNEMNKILGDEAATDCHTHSNSEKINDNIEL